MKNRVFSHRRKDFYNQVKFFAHDADIWCVMDILTNVGQMKDVRACGSLRLGESWGDVSLGKKALLFPGSFF